MRAMIAGLFAAAGEALAHEGHGLIGPHPHGWDYALVVIAVVAAIACALRR